MSASEGNSHIQQFLILAKNQKAKALETIIEQILSHPSIYTFGEFLSQPNFQEMGADNKHLRTLQLFAYENYVTYKRDKDSYIELKQQQIKKLKMITIADLAHRNKILGYQDLMRHLDIQNLRELEDLIVDSFYNDLVSGKLDQLNQQFHVVQTFGRDLRDSDIDSMLTKLEDWDRQLEQAQQIIEQKAKSCNQSILDTYERQLKHELEVREKREQVIKEMSEGRDIEVGEGGGPNLSINKKKSKTGSNKSDMHKEKEGGSGSGGFLNSFKAGFLNK